MAAVAPLPAVDPDALGRLRRALADAPFTGPAIQELLGTEGTRLATARMVPLHRRRALAANGPLGPLVTLLVLGLEGDAAEVEEGIGTDTLAALEALGLVETSGTALRPRCRLVPHDDILIASDLGAPVPASAGAPTGHGGALHVPGVQPPSAVLARLTIRRPVERALDVGTGSGIQAILASRHAGRVVATDVNERALAYAEFNCALNGVENVEFRAGSLLEPVEGERFGLVVSNPPFVVSPETALVFRDSGLGRDRLSELMVGAVPSVLEEDAYASIMLSWIVDAEDVLARVRAWADATGCAAWLLHTSTHDALAAAEGWNRHVDDPDELEERMGRWLAYYTAEGIRGLAYGCLVLRGGGPAWFEAWEYPDEGTPAAGEHLERLFVNRDLLGRTGDDALLAARLAIVEEAAIGSRAVRQEGDWRTVEAWVALERGLGFRAGLDPYATAVVTRLDGSRAVNEVFAEAAEATGMPLDVFTPPGLAVVRMLLKLGFAVPAG